MLRKYSVPSVLWLTGTLLAVGVSVVGHRVWEGEPYPAVVPDQVAVRLKGRPSGCTRKWHCLGGLA